MCVVARDGDRALGEVGRVDGDGRSLELEGDGDASRPGTEIEHARRQIVTVHPIERDLHEDLGVGTGHEHAAIDAERAPVELAVAAQIRDGLGAAPTSKQRADRLELPGSKQAVAADDDLHAIDREGLRDDQLGVETRALDASLAQVVGHPHDDVAHRPILRRLGPAHRQRQATSRAQSVVLAPSSRA